MNDLVKLLDSLNFLIANTQYRRHCANLFFKLKQQGWEEWQYISFDEDAGQLVFFNTRKEYDEFLALKTCMLITDLERTKNWSDLLVWDKISELETRLDRLEVVVDRFLINK